MLRRVLVVISSLTLVIGLIIGTKLYSEPKIAVFRNSITSVKLNYPDTVIPQPLTQNDIKDKIIFRAKQKQGQENQSFLITLRYEDGLRTAAQLSKLEPLDLVLNGVEKAFPLRFPEYKQIDRKNIQQAGRPGIELNFKYRGPSGEIIQQRFLVLMRNDNMAIYLAGQSKQSDFEKLRKDFNLIFNSVRFE